MALKKIVLDTEKKDHYVFIDLEAIRAIQVQLPIETSSLIAVQGEGSVGIIRVYLTNMSAPFQFTRQTAREIEALAEELTGQVLASRIEGLN